MKKFYTKIHYIIKYIDVQFIIIIGMNIKIMIIYYYNMQYK